MTMIWEEVTDEEGRVYYYNTVTQQTQWKKPDDQDTDALTSGETTEYDEIDKLLEDSEWKRATTDDKQVYYYNSKTEESVWELPKEIRKQLELEGVHFDDEESNNKIEDHQKKTTEDNNLEIEYPGNSIVDLKYVLLDSETTTADGSDGKFQIPRFKKSSAKTDDSKQYQDNFLEMLKEANVDYTWSFNKVMEQFIKDERYWMVRDPLFRKQMYEIYMIQKAEEEFQLENSSKEKYKVTFFEILKKYDSIKYYTRWKTCSKLILDEPVYSLISSKLKKEFFYDYVRGLRLKHEEEIRSNKKHALDNLAKELEPQLKIDSDIDDFIRKYSSYQGLNRLDFITVYESIMNKLEIEFDKKYQENRKLNLRENRKARDGFKMLMNEKFSNASKGLANLKWFEFLNMIKGDERFLSLWGRTGSSPIDFYWDLLDKENQILKGEKDLVKQILLTSNFKVNKEVENNYEEFKKLVGESKDVDKVNKENLQLIYDKLVEEAQLAKKRKLDETESTASKKRLTTLGYGAL